MFYQNKKRIDSGEPLKGYFWLLIFLLVFGIFSYGYCVRGAIVSVVDRQSLEADFSILRNKLVELEAEYIKIKSDITPELSYQLGFKPSINTKFVLKNNQTPGLSLVIDND